MAAKSMESQGVAKIFVRSCWFRRMLKVATSADNQWKRSIPMAKGQQRGNKEVKKPKQPPKVVAPVSGFGPTTSKVAPHLSEARKK